MTIKSLLVKISADVTELQGNLRKADGYVKTHAQEIGKIGKTMMVVGAAVTGAIGLMIGKYANAGDALLEMSQRTGMSTEKLSELKYAASLCGTDMGAVEIGAKKMAVSIAEAARGSDEAKGALGRLGLSAQELIALSPDQQFEKISTALAAIENPTIRADTAVKLFGRSGTDLLPILAGGVDGLNKMKKEAHDLGLVLSKEDCQKANEFKDTLDKLKGSITGVGNSLASMLVPNLTGIVDKIAGVITKVKDWTKAHPELSGAIIKVIGALSGLMLGAGSALIVIAKLAQSMKTLGVVTNLQLGPIAIVTAALAGLAVGYLAVKDAQDKANLAGGELTKQENKLVDDLSRAAVAAGWHYGEMSKLIDAYHGNIAALTMAIVKGKEGVAIQKALAAIGKEQKTVIDAEKQALLDKANAEIKAAMASEAAKKQAEAIMTTRRQLTDEIAKATMKEREYERFALEQAYIARKASITSEITDEKEKAALLLQVEQTYQASRAALEKSFRDQDLAARIAFAQLIADQEDQQTVDRIQNEKDYLAQKQQVTDAIKTMGMSQLASERYMIQQEAAAKAQEITDSKTLTEQQKTDLLAIWSSYYAALIQKNYSAGQILAEAWRAQIEKITQWVSYFISGLSNLFSQYHQNEQIRIDNEEKMKTAALDREYAAKTAALNSQNAATLAATEAEYAAKEEAIKANIKDEKKREALLEALEQQKAAETEALKKESDEVLTNLEKEKTDAEAKLAEELEKKKSELRRKEARVAKATALLSAIVNTASAIAEALPNIPLAIAVGILGAAQVALIARQPLPLAEGAVVRRPTLAMIGERGPEAVIPLDRPGALAMAGAVGPSVNVRAYFYGDIHGMQDIDAISKRLAERTVQAISKGRRY